eukprot:scaffold4490_cov133-Skeletonema_marinoi.AAC.2
MAKKVTELRIQRSVLRRVVQDKLQALLRGDFYVRNHLGEENYDPIVAEVKKLDEGVLMALMQHDKEMRSQQTAATAATTSITTAPPPTAQLQFSKELETFIQILAASIMIDASMRGENAGESDTRFIKKKKKLLTRMLMGGKLYTLRREIVRFHLMNKKGVKDGSAELIEAIGVDPPETEVEESSSEESESEVEERPKKRKYNFGSSTSKIDHDDVKSVGTMDEDSSDEEDDDDDDDSLSDTATSTSLSKSGAEDGFSTSATSSKKMKKAKKKARKEEKRRLKKERKRIKKEKKRKEKEEKKRKRKMEKELKKRKKMKHHHHHGHEKHRDNADFMEEEFDNDMDDADEVELDSTQMDGQEDDTMLEEVTSFEFKTKEEFEAYRDDIISQIPKSVRKRFRHGGFSKWGKDWLPVIELGPFDVEPGPVRDMWMDMFHNTQKSGREMTHLVFWYGVKFEDRGQGFSFVPDGKIMPYDEGERKGFNKIPKKIQTKIDKDQKLTKTEEQIKNGLRQIVSDMGLEKVDRIKWMMNFKEDYELAAEAAEQAAKAALEKAAKPKRKPGRPKKEESVDKPKRGPGRPKKVVDGEEQPKRKPGRPKKSEQEKAASKAKKFLVVDEDHPESNIDTDDDEEDENYGDDDSDSDDDLKADTDSDTGDKKSRKSVAAAPKKPGRKPAKPNMTEEEKAQERREKAAAYREKKAREKAEALGLEYVPGRKGRKSKATIMDEEQMKFTKCEEVFCPLMERLEKARSESDAEAATECLNLLMKRVELVTPPFLRTYGLGMVVKQTRKAFESTHPAVKDQCKKLTNEMKRLYTERDKNIPDEFEPVKNMKDKPKLAKNEEEKKKKKWKEKDKVPSIIKSEQKPEQSQTEKSVVEAPPKVKPEPPQKQPEKAPAAKLTSLSSTGSIPDVVKTEPQKKQLFSIKGMFERPKPKPVPRPKNIAAPNVVVSDPQMSPRAPRSLPSWVTGPAVKNDFHEQHVKERSFGLEFLIDAASKVSSEKFDPVSVSQSFELAIFAETKLRGRNWKQYWEKVHDIVAMLSPGKNKPNAILQGIKSGNYQEPSELVKLSRREIETVNNLS